MKHVPFGATGLRVSPACLGTMTFGLQCEEGTARSILDRAAAAGVDFLDTADVYPLGGGLERVGRTEEIVGRWLGNRRHDFVLATKCVGVMGPKPWQRGMSRRHVLAAVEASLKRLGTDYVDLYQFHRYDPATPLDEALEALETVVRHGKARYVGVSNWPAYKLARALGRSESRNLVRFVSSQPRYNLLCRGEERDMLPLCKEEGIAVIPYNPLAGGLLTGKHDGTAPPPAGSRFTLGEAGPRYQERYWKHREFETVTALRPVAAEAGMTLAAMAIRWVLSHEAVTAPILGASRPEQLDETLAAVAAGPLPADLKTRLDEMTAEWRAAESSP